MANILHLYDNMLYTFLLIKQSLFLIAFTIYRFIYFVELYIWKCYSTKTYLELNIYSMDADMYVVWSKMDFSHGDFRNLPTKYWIGWSVMRYHMSGQ